jgi:F0F1-type ATP synthase assembly protein I
VPGRAWSKPEFVQKCTISVSEVPLPKDNGSQWGVLMTVGFETLAGVLLGLFIGQWLDRKYGWSPWGTMGCTLLGAAAGMYLMIREGLRANRDPRPPKKPGEKE